MGRSTTNPVGRIAIAPSDWLRPFVVLPNVGANATREVGDRREDAAREQVAFDLRKPELDLIQPGRVGWREVQTDLRMLHEECANSLRFVGRQIVEDDVNLFR